MTESPSNGTNDFVQKWAHEWNGYRLKHMHVINLVNDRVGKWALSLTNNPEGLLDMLHSSDTLILRNPEGNPFEMKVITP